MGVTSRRKDTFFHAIRNILRTKFLFLSPSINHHFAKIFQHQWSQSFCWILKDELLKFITEQIINYGETGLKVQVIHSFSFTHF